MTFLRIKESIIEIYSMSIGKKGESIKELHYGGQSDNTTDRKFALHAFVLGFIPGIPHIPLSFLGIIPELKTRDNP